MGFISRHRLGKKSFLLKKTCPTFYTPFLFIKYSKTTHWKHHIHVIIQNVKKRGIFSIETIPPSIFKSREGNCPQLFHPWSGISEVRTADSYGASEFMSVRIFSCLCVSVFSFLGIPNFLSAIKYLSFCHVIFVYLYHILLLK